MRRGAQWTARRVVPALEQVSARYGGKISVRTLANWRWAGIGPKFSRLGGRILYPEDELLAWEQRNTVSHTGAYRK